MWYADLLSGPRENSIRLWGAGHQRSRANARVAAHTPEPQGELASRARLHSRDHRSEAVFPEHLLSPDTLHYLVSFSGSTLPEDVVKVVVRIQTESLILRKP